jgi:hypothetical protein
VIESWDLDRPAPIVWPDTKANREAYSPRMETPLVTTPDFALWEYRQGAGLTWADLTGQWPQPPWRTRLDREYQELVIRARRELQKKADRRA